MISPMPPSTPRTKSPAKREEADVGGLTHSCPELAVEMFATEDKD